MGVATREVTNAEESVPRVARKPHAPAVVGAHFCSWNGSTRPAFSRHLTRRAMITRHNVGGNRFYAHEVSGNVIRLSDVPRGHRPTRAETALDAALRVRMM